MGKFYSPHWEGRGSVLRPLLGDAISSPLATASIAYRNRMSEFMTDSLPGPTERACLRMCEVVFFFREVMAWPRLLIACGQLHKSGPEVMIILL